MPNDLPPWHTVYQQTRRWIKSGVFEVLVADLRALIRLGEGKSIEPTAAIFDSRTLSGSIENGDRGGYDGHKKRKGTKLHLAVDTLGEFLALVVTPADEQDRAQVAELAARVQEVTGDTVEVAFVDQGYTGRDAEEAAVGWGIRLEVVKLPEARHGFVLLPRRWVVERSFAWLSRFRRLARDYERLPGTVAGLHMVAFAALMFGRLTKILLTMSA
jgi:transposase